MKTGRLIKTFAILLIIIACHPMTTDQTQKMNARLRQQLRDQTFIRFNGECTTVINSEVSEAILNTGIRLNSTHGALFTASGSPRQIRHLVRLEFIKKLEAVPVYRPQLKEGQ
jgi:hypothetical protein